jgi:hypothetical protein
MKIPGTNFHVYSPDDERNVAARQREAAAVAATAAALPGAPPCIVTSPAPLPPRRIRGFAMGPKLPPADARPPFDLNRLANTHVLERVAETLANDGLNATLGSLRQTCKGIEALTLETLLRQRVQAKAERVATGMDAGTVLGEIADLRPGDQLRPLAMLTSRITRSVYFHRRNMRDALLNRINTHVAGLAPALRERFVLEALRYTQDFGHTLPVSMGNMLWTMIRSLWQPRQVAALELFFDLQLDRAPKGDAIKKIARAIRALPPELGHSAKAKVNAWRDLHFPTSAASTTPASTTNASA